MNALSTTEHRSASLGGAALSIRDAFAGRRVLLTGASGFLGKVWLLRLLEEVETVGKVTLLLRPNGVGDSAERWRRIVAQSPAFAPLRERVGDAVAWMEERVDVVQGDVSHPDLHMDPRAADALRGEIDLVVHCAALVDFDPDIRKAVAANVVGSIYAAEFAASCDNARLLHVSTCFVAGEREGRIEERTVGESSPNGTPFCPESELSALEAAIAETEAEHGGDPSARVMIDLGKARANALGWPNCYTYTKALAESLVDLRYPDLPHAVLRPSIVESALAFPFAGWNEGYNTCGPLTYLIGTWFKAMPARERNPFDVVPVDQVVNGLMIAGARLLEGDAPQVFQCGTSQFNRFTLGRALELSGLAQRRHLRAHGETLVDRQIRSRFDTTGYRREHPLSLANVTEAMKQTSKALTTLPDKTPKPWKKEAGRVARKLTRQRRTLTGIDKTVQAFVPFVRDLRQWFVTENLLERPVVEPSLRFAPDGFDWRDYWLNVHMPGMRTWCFPDIERDVRL